jgi:DNA-binding CsgD family transcriptional regulator
VSTDEGKLTPREEEILDWISAGKSNADIGGILRISKATVKTHAESIYRKLGVDNRTAAAAVWRDRRR